LYCDSSDFILEANSGVKVVGETASIDPANNTVSSNENKIDLKFMMTFFERLIKSVVKAFTTKTVTSFYFLCRFDEVSEILDETSERFYFNIQECNIIGRI